MLKQALADDYSWPEILATVAAAIIVGGLIAIHPMDPNSERYKQWYPEG